MMALGESCLIAARNKNMVKGSMMSEKYWGSYPNELIEFARYRGFAYLSFSEAKEIIKFIKKDIKKYAKLCEQQEAEKAAAEAQGGEMNEMDEIGDTKWGQKMLGMAGARRAEKDGEYNARGTWGERDYVGSVLPGYTTSDVPIYKHAAKEWGNNPKLRDAFVKGVQKQYKKMTGNKNGDPISLYEGLDELSPKLLQHASEKAWDAKRWSQSENFETEAEKRAAEEIGTDEFIKRITPKQIVYMTPDKGSVIIYRNGEFFYRSNSNGSTDSGSFSVLDEIPESMRVPDKRTARSITRWWKIYHEGDKDVPILSDWHNLVRW